MHFELKPIVQKDSNNSKHFEIYIGYSISTGAVLLGSKKNIVVLTVQRNLID
jgi:hypothetical protein